MNYVTVKESDCKYYNTVILLHKLEGLLTVFYFRTLCR